MECHPLNNPPSILIVDDNPDDIQIIEWALENYSYQIHSADNAADAYHLMESLLPDMLILDLVLPEQDGLKLLFDLNSRFPCIPIIIQTAYSTPQIAIEALRNGAYDFWQKPMRGEAIKVGVLRAVNYRRQLIERTSHINLLQLQQARLNRSRNKALALERMALLGHLTQGLMHEVYNPLAIIATQLFQLRQYLTKDQYHRLDTIDEAADRIHQVIDQLANALPDDEHVASVEIGQVAETAVKELIQTGDLRQIAVMFDVPDNLPLVEGRYRQLLQVVESLLENAAEAVIKLPEGERHILIHIEPHEDDLTLSIGNSGPPIPDEFLADLFDPQFTTQLAEGRIRGFGLGLFMARTIVESNGGTLSLDSDGDFGVIFRLKLPYYVEEDDRDGESEEE